MVKTAGPGGSAALQRAPVRLGALLWPPGACVCSHACGVGRCNRVWPHWAGGPCPSLRVPGSCVQGASDLRVASPTPTSHRADTEPLVRRVAAPRTNQDRGRLAGRPSALACAPAPSWEPHWYPEPGSCCLQGHHAPALADNKQRLHSGPWAVGGADEGCRQAAGDLGEEAHRFLGSGHPVGVGQASCLLSAGPESEVGYHGGAPTAHSAPTCGAGGCRGCGSSCVWPPCHHTP